MLHHLRARSRRVLLSGRRGPKSCLAAAASAAAPMARRHASSAVSAAAAKATDSKAAPQPTLRDFVAAAAATAAANGDACAGAARASAGVNGSAPKPAATADSAAKANGSASASSGGCGVLSSNAVKLRAGYQWSPEKEPTKVPAASDILNPVLIRSLLESTKTAAKSRDRVREILSAARERALLKDDRSTQAAACTSEYVQGLTLEETATLLNVDSGDKELMGELFATALDIKRRIYGNRIVLFAPLYLSNFCINSCTYCAFRVQNSDLLRSKLSDAELKAEVAALQKQGHRRLLLLTGEHPQYTFDDFLRAVDVVANVRTEPHGTIRRLNVEIPTLSVSDFRRLKATDQVGTYTLFQESYDEAVYNRSHPSHGRAKGDFEYRLQTMDRAQVAGVDDNGLGALFGLGDYKFEVMGLLSHGQHLDRTYGAGPHTISVPRMRPAHNAPDAMTPPHPVSDADFMKLVAIIRCAVPYTGMIMSTRETVTMRQQMLQLGISQMSAGSKTDVGSYYKGDVEAEWTRLNPNMTAEEKAQRRAELAAADLLHKREARAAAAPGAAVAARAASQEPSAQFEISDERSLDETVAGLMASGFVPSWCTACYRLGRTGQKFMKIAKSGNIQNYCHPNALLTLKEFERDYASASTSALANSTIEKESADVPSDFRRKQLQKKLARITSGQRDLYF